jgi:hypothetical protein
MTPVKAEAASPARRKGLAHPTNRLLLALLVGGLSWVVFRVPGLPLLAAIVFYAVTTALVSGRRT